MDEYASDAAAQPADVKLRRFGPEQQVVARVELAGPQRRLASVHAGVDVRGDGSTAAYMGRVRKRPLERAHGEDLIAAIRRALPDA